VTARHQHVRVASMGDADKASFHVWTSDNAGRSPMHMPMPSGIAQSQAGSSHVVEVSAGFVNLKDEYLFSVGSTVGSTGRFLTNKACWYAKAGLAV
jgi:hypothetical protein